MNNEIKLLRELIAAHEKYIQLLSDEIDDLSGLAMAHGFESKRIEEGNICRKNILKIEVNLMRYK